MTLDQQIEAAIRNKALLDAIAMCERRADSLQDGSAIARQCAKDIRSLIQHGSQKEAA